MAKRRELTVFERGMIIGLHKGQHGASDISRILDIPRETCRNVIKKYCEEGITEPPPRSGRPPLLTDREERTLIKTVREDRQESLQQITVKFNDLGLTPISTGTARRVLHKHDYFGRVGTRKPFVSENNRKKRLKWSRERVHWDEEWNTVIWSDESKFLLFESDGRRWVWHQPHEKYDVDCLVPTVKSNAEGVMVWGCFVKNKLGLLVILEGSITDAVYQELLENHLMPFIDDLGDDNTFPFKMIMLLSIEPTLCLLGKRRI